MAAAGGSMGGGWQQIAQAGFGALFTHQFKSRSRRAAKAAYQARMAALASAKGVITAGKAASTGYLTTGYEGARTAAEAGFGQARTDITAGAELARGDIERGTTSAIAGYQPYLATGRTGLSTLETLLTNPESVANTGAYRWALEQGLTSLDRIQGARGKRLSGQGLQEITQYGQGLASQQYQNVFSNALSLANIGERATGAVGQLEAGRGTALANISTAAGANLAGISQAQGMTLADISAKGGTALAQNEYNYGQDLANIELGFGGVAGQLASDKMNIEKTFTDYRFDVLNSATGQ